MLINARRRHEDFMDPFGTGFLHAVRTSIHISIQETNLAHGHSQSGPKRYRLEETPGIVEYGQYGYRRSGCDTGVRQKQQRHLVTGWNMLLT